MANKRRPNNHLAASIALRRTAQFLALTLPRPLIPSGRGLPGVIWLLTAPDKFAIMRYDPSTIAILRRAWDEVLRDGRSYRRKSASALEVAEHILAQAASGERDLERLKSSTFEADWQQRTVSDPTQSA